MFVPIVVVIERITHKRAAERKAHELQVLISGIERRGVKNGYIRRIRGALTQRVFTHRPIPAAIGLIGEVLEHAAVYPFIKATLVVADEQITIIITALDKWTQLCE